MVGLVLVCHSARLAEAVAELAAQVGGAGPRIGVAGGLDLPGDPFGTDAARVIGAIDEVWSEDGVLVLMDLGSAVLSAEMALDLMPDERRARVVLTEAPLVEGAVAAAVAAGLGDPLEKVAAEARAALGAKAAHLAPVAADDAQSARGVADVGDCAGRPRVTRLGASHRGRRSSRAPPAPGGGPRAGRGRIRCRAPDQRRHDGRRAGERAQPQRRGHARRAPR